MRLLCLAWVLVLASCGDDSDCCDTPKDAAVDAALPRVEVARVPVTPNLDVDMLFVVDDSVSTLDKQTNLKNAFPAFINELSALPGGLPNVHIGVVTPDLGTKGADDAVAGPGIGSGPGSCSGNGKSGNLTTNNSTLIQGVFISDIKNTDGTRTVNYTGSLATAFSAIASVGASGCGFEQPIEAAKRALNNNPANAGFLRATANLAIIMLTDEDDCSFAHSSLMGPDTATLGVLNSFRCTRFGVQCEVNGATTDDMNAPSLKDKCHSNEASAYLTRVDPYATFFKGLKSDPNNVLFTALIGNPAPVEVILRTPPGTSEMLPALEHSCGYNGANGPEVADPGVRIEQLANLFQRKTISSICNPDLSQPLVDLARQVRGLVGDTCLTRAIALPADCLVHEEVGAMKTDLPLCDNGAFSTNKPCYELVSDPTGCTGGSHLRLQVQRVMAPAPNAVVVAECRV